MDAPKTDLQMKPKQSGVYFLLKEEKIIYVGFTTNLVARLNSHTINFDGFRFMPGEGPDYESKMIKLHKPILNKNLKGERMKIAPFTIPEELFIRAVKRSEQLYGHRKFSSYVSRLLEADLLKK